MADPTAVSEEWKKQCLAAIEADELVKVTDLKEIGKRIEGKARDVYVDTENQVVTLVATDRVSAFDRHITTVPFKGRVLNQTSVFWFENTADIVPNHMISADATRMKCKPCTMFPVEFVVRGYLTGTTNTSIWSHYQKGVRSYCGHSLPDGMVKDQRLPHAIVTPTTKESDGHDEPITPEEILKRGLMKKEEWDFCHDAALKVFERGQKLAAEKGFLLVDTKYEFGQDQNGTILLADEVHTPDSSRFWLAGQGGSSCFDKDVLRKWYKERCDPYKVEALPEAPIELRTKMALRYIAFYETLTGKTLTL